MGTKGPKAIPVTSRVKRSLDSCGSAPLKQTGEKSWINKAGHMALDIAGLVPGVGEVADGINAAWYAGEGDYKNAALSAAAMVPFAGWAATGTKLGMKGAKALKVAKKVDKVANSKLGKFAMLNQPTKLGKYDRMGTEAINYALGSSDTKPNESREKSFINAAKNEIAKNKKTKSTNSNEGSANINKVKTKTTEKPKVKSNASSDTGWKKASKASGGNLSKLVKARNSAKKGSPEYAKAQNAINKAYGSKKRY